MLHIQPWTNGGADADGARSGSKKVQEIIIIIIIIIIITIIINIITIVIIVKVIIIILIYLTLKIYNSAVNQKKKKNANKIRRKRILE